MDFHTKFLNDYHFILCMLFYYLITVPEVNEVILIKVTQLV